jgi:hypothetical protein
VVDRSGDVVSDDRRLVLSSVTQEDSDALDFLNEDMTQWLREAVATNERVLGCVYQWCPPASVVAYVCGACLAMVLRSVWCFGIPARNECAPFQAFGRAMAVELLQHLLCGI